MELVEVAASPMGCGKAEPSDEAEQKDENGEGNPIQSHDTLLVRLHQPALSVAK
jgi:hypothetical protein